VWKKVLLELKEIRVHYDTLEAVKGISLSVAEGEVVALLGANGAGKSTIMRTIAGLEAPTGGEIRYKGNRIDGLSPRDIVGRGIALVPEARRLFPFMSVHENLRIGAYKRKDGDIERDMEQVYQRFPILKERRSLDARALSGGEQQMLAIARALMARPDLLLLDEPTLGLSPLVRAEIANIITDINHRGVSVLLVEQNARLALRLAHRGYVTETGRISLEGSAQELLSDEQVKRIYLAG
jgi:branched-chain amino acid transport system ATP-binding protein